MTARLMLPSVVAVMLVFTLVFGAAAASPGGMQVGDYVPFSFASLVDALQVMLATTLGASALPRWWIAVLALTLCVAAMVAVAHRRPMAWLAMLAIAGLPIALATLHIANTGMPRYFLLSSVAVLLLLTDLIATALTKGPGQGCWPRSPSPSSRSAWSTTSRRTLSDDAAISMPPSPASASKHRAARAFMLITSSRLPRFGSPRRRRAIRSR
ncbi:hypothetical protein QP175_10685 [Sphingomonas aerolata]|uniref:hypothetical protein n=1 Tax=Sphingomonas aerolata TaxID=185951 RepID=UPI002FDF854B